KAAARVLIREILFIGRCGSQGSVGFKVRGKQANVRHHLTVDALPRRAISRWRCINLHRSRVEAIRLGRRTLMISNDPVTILRISFATSARVKTLLMMPISRSERTTPVMVPLPPWTVTQPKQT